MAEDVADNSTPEIYEPAPPSWLPQASVAADLGYYGFHPPIPHQDEDLLSEHNVKNGLVTKPAIPAETYTTKAILAKTLKEDGVLSDLDDFMNQIFKRRLENLPKISPATFRPPPRVTLNDAKRQAWFDDLANPDVPLYKLGKSVPHGAKGHDLLDLLQNKNVAIPRAIWFLRVFGSNETAGMRNKPNYNPMQYSVDWANVVMSYLKKQLADIALPSAPRPGLNIKQTFKGVLSDTDTRERWISRFSYCLDLLRVFYSEGMVDHPTFLSWLVQQMSTCNLAQAGFAVRLVDDYLDGLIHCRALTRPLVEAFLVKMTEVFASSSKDSLAFLQDRLEYLLRRVFLAAPNTFVSPSLWTAHSDTLRRIFSENVLNDSGAEAHLEQSAQAMRRIMEQQLRDIELRNDALILKNLPCLTSGRLRSAVRDVQLLNSITAGTDLSNLPFFDTYISSSSDEFVHKVDILLSWCVTPFQYGDHRPYAAVTLLWFWRERANARATRRDIEPPDEIVQDHLFDWLDSSELAGDENNLPVVSLLFGELVQKELFSYAKYIQRVIARGEPGLSFNEDPGSRHRQFLRSIPLQSSSPALANQRKVTLYGVRARQIPEDELEKQIRSEIRTVLPELFSDSATGTLPLLSTLQSALSTLRTTSRYEQTRVIQLWLRPIIRKYFTSAPSLPSQEVLKVYCVAVEAMGLIRSYRSILETSLDLLAHATISDHVIAVTETLRRHADIWSCLNENGRITQALYASHQLWKSQGVPMQSLLSFILHMDAGRYLDPTARNEVNTEIAHYVQALSSLGDNTDAVPPVLPEILLLAQDANPEAPSVLASSLWYKYKNSYDWAWTVWDNVIASLRQIPFMMPDTVSRHACALRYAKFLFHIDQHLAGGLDSHALRWFLGSGLNEMSALSSEAWGIVLVVLLDLCIHGPLTATTLLQGVVYPGWQYGSTAKSEQQSQSVAVFVHATNRLCQLLLINDDGDSDNMPPTDLLQAQKIRTRRQDVYHEPHFSRLVNNVSTLVFLEHNAFLDEALRQDVKRLRYLICQSKDFRLGTYQNLDAVRAAFEKPLEPETISEALHAPFISAMCLILSDEETNILSDPPADVKVEGIASLLSPWKLAASAIAMQYLLKQLGESLSRETTREKSEAQLDRFAGRFFCHSISSDEAEFVAEMTRSTGTVVAGKFFKHGLQRIADILDAISSCEPVELNTAIQRTGDILKLLNNIRGPLVDVPSHLLPVDQDTSDKIFKSILREFRMLQAHLEAQDVSVAIMDISHVTNAVNFLSRLLQFCLLFPNPFRGSDDNAGQSLLDALLRTMLLYGGELVTDPNTFPVLLDTTYYVFDELAVNSKSPTVDLFQYCLNLEWHALPPSMPPPWRDAILPMCRYHRRDDATSNLVYASRDASGRLVYSTALQNRPWEWIEYLGENPAAEPKDRRKDTDEKERPRTNHGVRNNASISLELFGARLTGEGVVQGGTEEGNAIRMFEDNLASESMYERDWRESRLNTTFAASTRDDDGTHPATKAEKSGTVHRASPAPSPLSRSSAYTVPSRMPSPAGKLAGSSREPIDVDAPSVSSLGSKRTAANAHLDDDDLVVLSGPAEADSSAGKKGKGNATSKAKTRKK